MIKVYRRKPVSLEALQWTGDNFEEIKEFAGEACKFLNASSSSLVIATLEGEMLASQNDYIIKGVKGEFYPCKPDVFVQIYEEVEG